MEQSLQSRAQGDDAVWNGLGLRGTSYRAPAPAPRPGRGERLEIPGAGHRRASGCRGPRRGRLSEELLTHDGLFPVRGRGRGSVRRAHGGHPVFWTAGAVPDDYLVGAAPTPARSRFGTGRAASACELPNRVRAADSQPARHRLAGGPCDSEGLPLRPRPPDRCSAALPGGREGSPGEAVGTLGPLGHPPRPARPLLRRLVRRRPRVRGPGQPSRAAASGARVGRARGVRDDRVRGRVVRGGVDPERECDIGAVRRRADEHPPRARVEVGAGGRGRGEAAGRPSTISTPRSAHGSRAGSRSASTVMRRPSTTRASPSTVTGRPSRPAVV